MGEDTFIGRRLDSDLSLTLTPTEKENIEQAKVGLTAPRPQFKRVSSSRDSDGFIGGLKLRLADEALNNETIRQAATVPRRMDGTFSKWSDSTRFSGEEGVNTGISGDVSQTSRKPSKDISTPGDNDHKANPFDAVPALPKRNGSRRVSLIPEKSPKREIKQLATTQPIILIPDSLQNTTPTPMSPDPTPRTRPFRPTSLDRPPISYREPPTRGRDRSSSYVSNSRQQSADRSIRAFHEEDNIALTQASTRSRSRSRSWSIASLTGRKRKSSASSRPGVEMGSGKEGKVEKDVLGDGLGGLDYHTYLAENSTPSLPTPTLHPNTPTLKSSAPTFAGLKSAARAAFSRHSTHITSAPSVGSPSTGSGTQVENADETRKQLRTRLSGLSLSSGSKADRVLGANLAGNGSGSGKLGATKEVVEVNEQSTSKGTHEQIIPKVINAPVRFPQFGQDSPSSLETSSTRALDESTAATSPAGSEKGGNREGSSRSYANIPASSPRANPTMSGALNSPTFTTPRPISPPTQRPQQEVSQFEYDTEPRTRHMSLLPSFRSHKSKGSRSGRDSPLGIRGSSHKIRDSAGRKDLVVGRKESSAKKLTISKPLSNPDLKEQDQESLSQPQSMEKKERKERKEKGEENGAERKAKDRGRKLGAMMQVDANASNTSESHEKGSLTTPLSHLRHARAALPSVTLPPSLNGEKGAINKSSNLNPHSISNPHSNSTKDLSSKNLTPTTLKNPSTTSLLNKNNPQQPLQKVLIICCNCTYFHDLPSKLYACMAGPDEIVEDRELGVRGVVRGVVRCPWCGHGMGRGCCQGWVCEVSMRERLH